MVEYKADLYGTVAAEWLRFRSDGWMPRVHPDEAKRAAALLFEFGMGRKWTRDVQVTSGNRRTWVRNGVLFVNPDQGWREIVHDLSHYVHWRNGQPGGGHGEVHARLETRMAEHVVNSGWLDGKLRSHHKVAPRLKPDKLALARAAVDRLQVAEEREQKRHARNVKALRTRMRKAKASLRYYEKKALDT